LKESIHFIRKIPFYVSVLRPSGKGQTIWNVGKVIKINAPKIANQLPFVAIGMNIFPATPAQAKIGHVHDLYYNLSKASRNHHFPAECLTSDYPFVQDVSFFSKHLRTSFLLV